MIITSKKIPHNYRNRYLKNTSTGGFISNNNGGGGNSGLPYTFDENGDYIIDRKVTFKGNVLSTGEVCAYAEDGAQYEAVYSPLIHMHSISEVDNLQSILDSISGGTGTAISIVDNLISTDSNTALSANQGRVLKALIDNKSSVSSWDELLNKPSTFPPSTHTHNENYYLKNEVDTKLGTKQQTGDYVTNTSMNNGLATKSNNGHGHNVHEISNAMPHDNFHWNGLGGQPTWLWGGNNKNDYNIYNPSNFSVNNTEYLNGHNRNNLYSGIGDFTRTVGNLHSIVVEGDKETYYPVCIRTNDNTNWIKNEITISKSLGSQTPVWEGNHPDGSSSGLYRYEYRVGGWDGNCGYIKTLHTHYEYAPIVAQTTFLTQAAQGLAIWLRGGGCQYYISANNPIVYDIFYSSRNVGYHPYNQYVEPMAQITNAGVVNTKEMPIEVRNSGRLNDLQSNQFMRSDESTSCNGNILATGEITAYSDKRLKSNIKKLTNRGKLNPITYIKDNKESIGFIAQEVQEIYPELVIEEQTENKYLSLNYNQLTAVLASQINELTDTVNDLIKQINELKNK